MYAIRSRRSIDIGIADIKTTVNGGAYCRDGHHTFYELITLAQQEERNMRVFGASATLLPCAYTRIRSPPELRQVIRRPPHDGLTCLA